ncbi:MAG: hypothetical protein GTO22_14160 [Gemmatimonadales bacterium]|nr:hypothetical protein [Gemmatimonadales bacterium]
MVAVLRARRVKKLPEKGEGMFYASSRTMLVPMADGSHDARAPGEPVPEAFDWPGRNLRAALSLGKLVYAPYACDEGDLKAVMAAIPAKALKGVATDLGLDASGSAKALREAICCKLRGGELPPTVRGLPTPPPAPEPAPVEPETPKGSEGTSGDSGAPRALLEAMDTDELCAHACECGIENAAELSREQLVNAILVSSGYEEAAE